MTVAINATRPTASQSRATDCPSASAAWVIGCWGSERK